MTALNAIVTQRIEVSPGLIILRVVPDGWELPDFEPGQFAVLGLPGSAPRFPFAELEDPPADPEKMIKRAYSIASSSVSRQYLELYVMIVRSGALTPRLFHLEVGNRLWLGPKFAGIFTLQEVPPDHHIVLISTGTGLAPYMSMMRSVFTCGGPRHFAVVHGARHSWDLGYRSELHTYERLCPNFTYIPVISRPKDEAAPWQGFAGYVQDAWRAGLIAKTWGFAPEPASSHVFLCGNPGMVEAMMELLKESGYEQFSRRSGSGQVHMEKYW